MKPLTNASIIHSECDTKYVKISPVLFIRHYTSFLTERKDSGIAMAPIPTAPAWVTRRPHVLPSTYFLNAVSAQHIQFTERCLSREFSNGRCLGSIPGSKFRDLSGRLFASVQELDGEPSTSDANQSGSNVDRQPDRTYNVVITGGSKGAGKALALKFLQSGDNVVVCSRDADRVAATVNELQEYLKSNGIVGNKILGMSADVTSANDMNAVAAFTKENFGSVDIWVNNAGTNGYTFKPFFEQNDEDIASVVTTNILGVMYGTKAAINAMKTQPKGGHVFNMDGAGADGNATPRFAAYGATKRSLDQFNKSMRAELNMAKISNVGVHAISPGMVTTELLMAGADNRFSRLMINCLAETPDTMAEFLVPKIREVPQKVEDSFLPSILLGQYIKFLTPVKAYSQIIMRLIAGERKDRFVVEDEDT
jgi:chlorophyll(ide) b reductase